MNTINGKMNPVSQYNQTQSINRSGQHGHHHHWKASGARDAIELSTEGMSAFKSVQKNPMDELVSNGTLTQEQADAVKKAVEAARAAGLSALAESGTEEQEKPLDTLVQAGTLTQEQADSVQALLKGPHHPHHGFGGKEGRMGVALDSLVKAGTITQEQEDAIKKAIGDGRSEKNGAHGTVPVNAPPGALKGLVKAGTLTQEQADAIRSAFQDQRQQRIEAFQIRETEYLKSALSGLVDDGTLTQEQSDAIESAFRKVWSTADENGSDS